MSFRRIRSFAALTIGGATALVGYNVVEGDERFYSKVIMPCIFKLMDGEEAHLFAIRIAKLGLLPHAKHIEGEKILETKAFNKRFPNPIGCAAGFDKNGEAIDGLFNIGFGFVEIGTVTPLPQEGNPKPRVFRLREDAAVINRYGFNGQGLGTVLARVLQFKNEPRNADKILGVNIGKNKLTTDACSDYLSGMAFAPHADYIVINISSPNTPGLRNLQGKQELQQLIDSVLDCRERMKSKVAVLVKIAPDLSDLDMQDIAAVLTRPKQRIDGLIVSNTTISRPSNLRSEHRVESGGLSGAPLREMANHATQRMYELTDGQMAIIGVGGIATGRDALERIKSGASLVQLYTSMVYEGPPIVNKIKHELIELLKEEGFSSVNEAVGFNFKKKSKINKQGIC